MIKTKIGIIEKEFLTLNEAVEKTGIEYHTLLARLKRDKKGKYKAYNTKWGWIIHPDSIQIFIEE